MTEILSREKELFQINQELNLMSLSASAEDGNPVANQSRYGTYLKQKGPSTLLKKKLNVEALTNNNSNNNNRATGRGQRVNRAPKSPNKISGPISTPTTPSASPPLTTPRGKSAWTPLTKSKMAKAPQCKLGVSAPIANRMDGTFTRRASHRTATYVKYRNPNFKQSPSLDLLLRHSDDADAHKPVMELEVQQTRESTTVVNGQAKKQLTQDNFIRFLKAKVAILEEDHGQLTLDMANQKERLEETLELLRKAENQRDQAINSNAKLTDQLHRFELQAEDSNRCQKDQQLEQNKQKQELELLRRDAKVLKQTNANLEKRLLRANDEAEAARQLLGQQAGQQRDELDHNHKELKLRDNRIKALKRQRADLLNAYKKQLFLIDNLKRQNSCVEQAVAIGFGEKEFNKVLEWNTASKPVY
ncbi:testis-expressed protein 9 [Drosophila grimshawi]|uniref:GH21889 n=1 Tax=Drosophila grimshawi TaxID=7222 RepID=B4J813_DROGR|nr:testis-expressed protein 9 [Drosophila grimshawi]EDW02243.1 GH21889 [Drosophila grimshawi]